MSEQKWADAATQNCVWLLQHRRMPTGSILADEYYCIGDDEPKRNLIDDLGDNDCWHTEAVFLTRLEAFETGARRTYHYGQYGRDWRIYGVPAKGRMVDLLAQAKVDQALIDAGVELYKKERPLWEKENSKCKDL